MTADRAAISAPDHPRFSGYGDFYRAEILPWLSEQEATRRRTLRDIALVLLGAIPAAVVVHLAVEALFDNWSGGIIVALLAIGAALVMVRNFKSRLKSFLVPKTAEFLGISYDGRGADIGFRRFVDNGLVPRHSISRFEDGLDGAHAGASFRLCEAMLYRQFGKRRNEIRVFRGLLFEFDFHKRFKGRTIVTPEPRALGKLYKGRLPDRVRLEDPGFERIFRAFGTDQVEARYLLSPAFMERVVALGRVVGRSTPSLAFIAGRLLISVRTRQNKFEGGSILRATDDPRRAEQLLEEFHLVFQIIETVGAGAGSRV